MASSNPTVHIETPKQERRLPKVLSTLEVDALLNSPCTSSEFDDRRNKAMLELLYATGMRVSELCSLKLKDLHLAMGFYSLWKRQQRKNYSSKFSCKALSDYLEFARHVLLKKKGMIFYF
ncbi:tyrosine-type recombinase/integrase [Anaerobacillus sp. HL2]|nr:tyrosine-type recombinase/integrase [Anaerobacillus sp. HL2]